jgi:hypothetical protein
MHYPMVNETHLCCCLPCSNLGQDNCNFENGWCIWRNVNKLWYRQSGGTNSSRTGPTGDNSGLKGGECTRIDL